MLENYIRERRAERSVLIMTHIVMGYPDFETSMRTVEAMVEAGVDLMELQVPFSEPIADGPVILRANQEALENGVTVDQCFEFAGACARRFDIPFLFMSYYNILYRRGVELFVEQMRSLELKGAIVPDLPPEEARAYLTAMESGALSPIFIYSPNTTEERLNYLAKYAGGFIYCVARKGVTGATTDFSMELDNYLARCRCATGLPLAVGFGIKNTQDVQFLEGKADIAVVGSESIRILDESGVNAVSDFVAGLVT